MQCSMVGTISTLGVLFTTWSQLVKEGAACATCMAMRCASKRNLRRTDGMENGKRKMEKENPP